MISVVSPVFNSETTIKKFILTLVKYLKKTHQKYEIVLINDNSEDNSKKIINKINKKIVFIDLKKNIGQHKALFQGLKIAKGNTIITIDSDLQDSPRYIPKLYALHKVRKEILMVSLKKNFYRNHGYIYSFLFWNIFFIISQKKNYSNPSNYLIFSKKDLKDFLKIKKKFILFLDFLFMNKKINVYKGVKLKRRDKKSSYTYAKVFNLAFKILFHYNILLKFKNFKF
jgi:glycosyltransferase involved in cell wall biosynthesis